MRQALFYGLVGSILVCGVAAAQEVYQPTNWEDYSSWEQRASWTQNQEPIYRLPDTDLPLVPPPVPEAPPQGEPATMEPDGEPPLPIPEDAIEEADTLEVVVPAVVAPAEPPPKIWEGSVELGVNGSEGNSQTFNFRFGAHAKRKTKFHVLSADLDYHKNSNDSVETANRALFEWRYERLFDPSRWTWFVHGTVDHDEFKTYDARISVDSGLGYQFIKSERTTWIGRLGAGFSREIGGLKDEEVPELVFGTEFEHEINDRQKVKLEIEYLPDASDFTECRIRSELGWQVVLDESMNLSLKASIIDRYDSAPEDGDLHNDLDYALTLLWSY